MAYTSGILRYRIKVLNRTKAKFGKFGLDSSGAEWQETAEIWADVEWAKGMRSLNAGAIDAYAVVLIRTRWTPDLNMRSRIVHEGQVYQILPETFHADKHGNTIQFNAQLIVNDKS